MKNINFLSVGKDISLALIFSILILCFPLLAQGLDVPLISTQVSTINLPQTGQTKCYDSSGNEINCAGTGQDGEIRAGVKWPEPRFIMSEDCVTDNLTGLMWAQDGNLADSPKPWEHALDFIASLNNSGGLCGYTDWRLPNVNELETLLNAGESDSATWLNSQGFIGVQSDDYWSSTTDPNGDYAYSIPMQQKGSLGWNSKSFYFYVWPVRGGPNNALDTQYPANVWKTGQTISYAKGDDGDLQWGFTWPNPRLTDNMDGTVTDNLTGFMWTKDAYAPGPASCNPAVDKTFHEALSYTACLNTNRYLGYSDWRLPNRKELFSLLDYSNEYPALPSGHPFVSVSGSVWSSTGPCSVYISLGGYYFDTKFYHYRAVWPVRGGVILEYVSTPEVPSGPVIGTTSTGYTYFTGGSYSNLGHSVEYQFDWKGDGTDLSSWGSATQSKTWDASGTYNVLASARCTTDTNVVSSWSGTLSVTISSPETVSTPTTLSGPTSGVTGTSYSYTTEGSTSNLGHSVQYFFDWGDGTNSGWLPVGTTSASKTWTSTGTFSVKSQARCAADTSVGSSWTGALSITISTPTETISNPNTPTGPNTGVTNTSYSYSTGGSISSIGHSLEYRFDWKGDGSDLSPWGSTTQSKTWTTAGTYNIKAKARCTTHPSIESGWSGVLSMTIASVSSSTATRDLPGCYTPFTPLSITISVIPSQTTLSYAVEETPPTGWTVSNINESGLWDSANKKVKWGPFFSNMNRTLTYKATPPSGEDGTKAFSGTSSFNGKNVAIGGESTTDKCVSLPHPADTNNDYRMSIDEVTAYGAAWKTGQTWPTPPNPIPIEYITNAGYLWQSGEVYKYDGQANPPWVPATPTGLSFKNRLPSKAPATLGSGTVTRDLPDCYTPSVAVSVSIPVTPGQGTQVYAVEDTPPNGWTVSNINENGQWDSTNKKVKWGPFFDSNVRTLTYQATPPSGENGTKTFSGTGSFDGTNIAIGGESAFGSCGSPPCSNPETPSNPSPSNGATGISTSPTLSWSSCANTDSYDVYFGTSSNPPYVGNTTSTSYSQSGLSYNTLYYWKIVAKNNCGNSTSGSVWSFTTSTIPSCPSLYFWDGDEYVFRGTIFPGAFFQEKEYRDHITLSQLTPKDGQYILQIRETEPERSFIDMAYLIIIDRSSNDKTDVLPNRKLMSESQSCEFVDKAMDENDVGSREPIIRQVVLYPVSATHSVLGDVRRELIYPDNRYVRMDTGEIITLVYPYLPEVGATRDFIFVVEGYYIPL